MTDQTELTPFPELEKLEGMLSEAQVRGAQELFKIKQELADRIDPTEYNIKRKQSADLHNSVSETLIKTIQETKEQTRRNLADALLAPSSNQPEDVRHYRSCIDLVEGAGQDNTKIEELIHRALKYKDSTLARLLVRAHCGTPDRKTMHQALSQVDPIIKATYDFESHYGAYVKQDISKVWAGWLTPEQANTVWVDGIPGRTKSPYPAKRKDWRTEQ